MNKKFFVPFIGIVGLFVSIFAVAEINTTQTKGNHKLLSSPLIAVIDNSSESFELYVDGGGTPPGQNGPGECHPITNPEHC